MVTLGFRKHYKPTSFRIDTFDIMLYNDPEILHQLQARFSSFLRGLDGPARFVTWHMPSNLQDLIQWTIDEAAETPDAWRRNRLMEYRQWYEDMERHNTYQQSSVGMTLWSETDANPHAIAQAAKSAFGTSVHPADWPPLLRKQYRIAQYPMWHLEPVGKPGGRPYVCVLGSYSFSPVEWNFYRPLAFLYAMGIPVAVCIDIPKTYEPNDAVAKLEGVLTALKSHLTTSHQIDTGSERQISDAMQTLADIHAGQNLHEVQIKIAVAADDLDTLKESVEEIRKRMKPFMGLRVELGNAQLEGLKFFTSTHESGQIVVPQTTHPMLSDVLALSLGFIGVRKLQPREGIIRGVNVTGGYPYIYDDWETSTGKKALHEVWVGTTGVGKTFALNCYLSRSLAHYGIPFDLLEPMGHGRLLASAFNIEAYSVSAKATQLNPHDPVFPRIGPQVTHVLRIYETILGRSLSGTQQANLEKGLLGEVLERFYAKADLTRMRPSEAPLISDLCEDLFKIGDNDFRRDIARGLAQEISSLATGSGPFAHFLNGHTNIDFSIAHEHMPRIFCFDEIESNDTLIAIAYGQVMATLMRTAMINDRPRIIAVDEVYRMMRHPSLLKFLIDAVKTLRTKRKKVIVIDQQLRVFLQPDTRLLFENCPIRVLMGQKGGEDIIQDDPSFQHFTTFHKQLISQLRPQHALMETPEGLFYLHNQASDAELMHFGKS